MLCRVDNDEEWLGQLQGIVFCKHKRNSTEVYVVVRWYFLTKHKLTGANMNLLDWDKFPDGSPAIQIMPADSILSSAVIMPHPDPHSNRGQFVHNHLFG